MEQESEYLLVRTAGWPHSLGRRSDFWCSCKYVVLADGEQCRGAVQNWPSQEEAMTAWEQEPHG